MVMLPMLLQITTTSRLEAIRQQFTQAKSFSEIVLPLFGIFTLLCLAAILSRLVQRRRRRELDHPGRLFRGLLRRLGLPSPQRDLLRRIAAHHRLGNPTVLLLGRQVFERHAQRWLADRNASPQQAGQIAELAQRLFPADYGTATSASAARPPASATGP
ncbi:MAG: hypothetical protein ACYSUI_12125 [Planctomycetota bacterium]